MQSRTPSLKRAPARSRAPPPHRGGANAPNEPSRARATRRANRTRRDARGDARRGSRKRDRRRRRLRGARDARRARENRVPTPNRRTTRRTCKSQRASASPTFVAMDEHADKTPRAKYARTLRAVEPRLVVVSPSFHASSYSTRSLHCTMKNHTLYQDFRNAGWVLYLS